MFAPFEWRLCPENLRSVALFFLGFQWYFHTIMGRVVAACSWPRKQLDSVGPVACKIMQTQNSTCNYAKDQFSQRKGVMKICNKSFVLLSTEVQHTPAQLPRSTSLLACTRGNPKLDGNHWESRCLIIVSVGHGRQSGQARIADIGFGYRKSRIPTKNWRVDGDASMRMPLIESLGLGQK